MFDVSCHACVRACVPVCMCASSQAVEHAKQTPAYRNRLKALQLEKERERAAAAAASSGGDRGGGKASRRAGRMKGNK